MTCYPQKIAAKFMISPSTLRNYEAKGLIPPAERGVNGYRMFTERHEAYLACIQAMSPAFGMEVTTEALHRLREDKLHEALWIVKEKEVSLYEEKGKLVQLIQEMERYASANGASDTGEWFTIREAAARTGVPKSAIRYWEKAGLLAVQRDPANEYRRYRTPHLFVIRLLQVLQSAVYSETTVKLKQSIAAAEQTDIPQIQELAANILAFLDKVNASQIRGIAYLYRLIRMTKAEHFDESQPWEENLLP